MIQHWGQLSSKELSTMKDLRPVTTLVLGAIEQHGPHLPLATDGLIGEGLLAAAAAELPADFPLIALPSLSLGASAEHAGFAGTLSLPAEQMKHQVVAIGEGLARAGLQRLVLINAHGGNIGWMDEAALELRRRRGLLVVKASYMRFQGPAELAGSDELHGGLAETAMMLHLAPDLVDMDQARNFIARHPHDGPLPPEGEAPWAWLAEDLNRAGVVGNAAAASAELGEKLIAHYARRLAGIIAACRDKDWPPADDC